MVFYDYLPKRVKERLQKSPFNICPACVSDFVERGLSHDQAIEEMEKEIRAEEASLFS